jgi:hypothetical protein
MKSLVSAFLIGILFGLGITVSGMINPAKVLNFFDLAGNWDPSLAFVMGGGLVTALIGYRLVFGQLTAPISGCWRDRSASRWRRGGIRGRLGHCRLLPGRRDPGTGAAARRNAGVRCRSDCGYRDREDDRDQAAYPGNCMTVAEAGVRWHEGARAGTAAGF